MKKRLLAILLCLVMALSLLACGTKNSGKEETTNTPVTDTKKEESTTEGTTGETEDEEPGSTALTELPMPLTEEKVELEVFMFYENSFLNGPNDIAAVQEMEKRTNVHINWSTVTMAELSEKWGLLLASGDIPDLMYAAGNGTYPGGLEKGVEDGLFMEMTDLVANYMPNYRALREADPELIKDTMTDSGKQVAVYAFNSTDTEITAQSQWCGLTIRRDLLNKWGYTGTPETIEDWHALLTLAKENGADAPLLIGNNAVNFPASFLTAYGMLPGFYQENGVVKYAAAQPAYKEWVQLFRDWYAEGLIDPNFVSNDATMLPDFAYATSERSVAFAQIVGFTENALHISGFTPNADIDVEPVLSPVLNAGDTPICYNVCSPAVGHPVLMGADTEYPEIAAMWLDYQYSQEGMMLNFYGLEGETYNIVDGEIQFTDLILNNPEGHTKSDALSIYARGNGIGRYNWNVASHYDDPTFGNNMDYWEFNQDFSMNMPAQISMTEEEGVEYSSLYTSIETLTNEMTVKFIMGTESMDKFDSFVEDLYKYGLERCIEIKQAGLDRYNNRGN